MGSPLLTSSDLALCPHGGRVVAPGHARVVASGVPVVTLLDAGLIAGCPSLAGDRPNPCVSVQWIGLAARVLIDGQPAVVQAGAGICIASDRAPAGPVSVVAGQTRVMVR